MHRSLEDMRIEYAQQSLDESDVDPNPLMQFDQWFGQARDACGHEANAMTVATADARGMPSVRMVLLKEYDEQGFVFFTQYRSRKGHDLEMNPNAALLFYWPELERQVRISGAVERVNREESERYFHSRPTGSQLSAIASVQSQPIANREIFEKRIEELRQSFGNKEIPVPEEWGGYRVIPRNYEFWQGRPSRLHDRMSYQQESSGWRIERLQP